MTHATMRAALVAALITMSVGACDTSSEGPQAGSERPTTSAQELMVDSSIPVMVESKDYRKSIEVPTSRSDRRLIYQARRGGVLVLSESGVTVDDQGPEDLRGDRMVLYDTTSGDYTELPRHGTSNTPSYIANTTVSGSDVVWVEHTENNMGSFAWEMYAYDLDSNSTDQVRKIASHTAFGIDRPPRTTPDGVWPVVLDDWVYFAALDKLGKGPKDSRGSVYRVPLKGGAKPEMVAPGAYDVRRFGDHLAVQIKDEVVEWDPARGESGEIEGSRQHTSCGFRANEDAMLRCPQKNASLLEVSSATYGRFTVDIGKLSGPAYLNVTDRWAGFNAGDKAYVLDLKRGRLMRLDGAQTAGWSDFTGGEMMYQNFARGADPVRYEQKTLPLIELLPK